MFMAKNKLRKKIVGQHSERHDTAAWANISSVKPHSKVTIPDEMQVENAKEYVDSNEK